jgi:antitoxin ParD1/3/4
MTNSRNVFFKTVLENGACQYEILYLLHVIFMTCLREINLKLVTVLLPEAYLEGLDELVRANMYPSRSSAIRSSVRDLLKKELWERRGR